MDGEAIFSRGGAGRGGARPKIYGAGGAGVSICRAEWGVHPWLKSTLSLVSECLPSDTIAAPFATSLGERRIVRKTKDSFLVPERGDETYIFRWVWNVQLLKPS